MTGFSIETGYFVLTMMPSLRCSLNCPHCYLTKEQRRDSEIMEIDALREVCRKVDAYYRERRLPQVVIKSYWYGGEPTQMPMVDGRQWIEVAAEVMAEEFPAERGYRVEHTILTSLITVPTDTWFPIFDRLGNGYFQTSYDGLMRGSGYLRKWVDKVHEARDAGLSVGTISVVNRTMLEDGPEAVMADLVDLGITEASFLPFMLNDRNAETGKYDEFAPTMNAYSDFMIRLTEEYIRLQSEGKRPPEIGQMHFVLAQGQSHNDYSNIAGQTLFLMPNGDFSLPDYHEGYQEFLRPFGNIFEQSFGEVLTSRQRRGYLRRQVTRNHNPECLDCPHSDKCVMEFWKPNRDGDDCFGASRYINWLQANAESIRQDHVELY